MMQANGGQNGATPDANGAMPNLQFCLFNQQPQANGAMNPQQQMMGQMMQGMFPAMQQQPMQNAGGAPAQ